MPSVRAATSQVKSVQIVQRAKKNDVTFAALDPPVKGAGLRPHSRRLGPARRQTARPPRPIPRRLSRRPPAACAPGLARPTRGRPRDRDKPGAKGQRPGFGAELCRLARSCACRWITAQGHREARPLAKAFWRLLEPPVCPGLAYQIVESFLRRSAAYTRSKLTLPMLEGICRDAANLYPPRVSRPTNAAVRAKGVVSLPLAFDLKGNCRTGRNTLAVLSFRGPLRRFVSVRSV
jgi:hypothetical protein